MLRRGLLKRAEVPCVQWSAIVRLLIHRVTDFLLTRIARCAYCSYMPSNVEGRGGLHTARELLHGSPVQSCTTTAIILHLFRRNGEPNRRAVHDLIRRGSIVVVDPTVPIHRWTIASAEIERYVAEGPRKGAA